MDRAECLQVLARERPGGAVVVTTMGCVAPWAELSDSTLDYPSAGSAMGHAADLAMGIALARPERQVWCLNGDGSMLMCLGTLVTVCQTPAPNLVLFVLQNDTYEVTGNQPIPGHGRINLPAMARAAGFPQVHEFNDAASLTRLLPDVLAESGPTYVNLRIQPGEELPPKLDCSLCVPTRELRDALLANHGSPPA